MTHEGRMTRGKANSDKGILPDNADTIYYLANKATPVEEVVEKPKKEKKNASKQR